MTFSRVLAAACVTAAIPLIHSEAIRPATAAARLGAGASGRHGEFAAGAAPPRMTVTTPDKIPVDKLKVPSGFKVELWAHGMPGARMMTRGDKGTIFVGTRTIGRVYAVTDSGGAAQDAGPRPGADAAQRHGVSQRRPLRRRDRPGAAL